MARAPKVYSADIDGVHEWIVAATNQRAALDALGVHQDLFAQGRAAVEKDPLKVEAAREQPGVALRRAKGSKGDFEPVSESSNAWDAALKAAPTPKPPAKAKAALRAAPKPAPQAPEKPQPARTKATRPDRAPLREAEAALKAFEREAARTLSDIDDEREAVERRERQARMRIDKQREALSRAINRARSAYEAAGGRG